MAWARSTVGPTRGRSDWPLWQGVPRMVPPPFGPPPKVRAAPRSSTDLRAARSVQVIRPDSGHSQDSYAGRPRPSLGQSGTWTLPHCARGPGATAGPVAEPRKSIVPAGITAVVLALAVAASYHFLWGRPGVPAAQGITPLYEAAAGLEAQPILHYKGSQGATSWDMYVTESGDQIGAVTFNGARIETLTVGGVTYLQVPQNLPDLLIQLPSGVTAASLTGKWITGDTALAGLLPTSLGTPSALATRLEGALERVSGFPTATAAARTSVSGVPALAVETADGELYVSASAPYRVLRIVDPPRGGGQVQNDLEPVTAAEQKQARTQIIDDTRQLSSAVNLGVSLEFNQLADLNCSETDCVVSEEVGTSESQGQGQGQSDGGTVTAVMSATVTVGEDSVGSCTDTSSIPMGGGMVVMSCVAQLAVGSGLLEQEPVAQAEVVAQALSQYEIDQLVDQETGVSSTKAVK